MIGTARVIRGDARALPIESSSVDLIVTSPPYWGLRSYRDGGEHYAGQIGHEATVAEFVVALMDCTREWMRVLKPNGSMWVNLGDKYEDRALLGIPWRYAFACMDLGLHLRAEVIWSKTDGLPQQVSDRPRRTHEHWFQMSALRSCYADLDAIRSPYEGVPQRRGKPRIQDRVSEGRPVGGWAPQWTEPIAGEHPDGKLPGSVWPLATSKFVAPSDLNVSHFAAFPPALPERIIKGWCPEGGTVLDPFGGSGTTAMVAKALGRHGISNDMSVDYCRLAEWRTNDSEQLAKVAQPEQDSLFATRVLPSERGDQ